MTFVFAHPVSTICAPGRRAVGRLRSRGQLTPQQRANRYVSRMAPAILTASVGARG